MISKYSVKRPYTVLVAVILAIVLGAVSLIKMTTDLLPDMSFQYALIMTTDVGATPETVETDVTAPIEAAIATTSNIKNITSTSYNNYSMVVCEYEQNANMDSVVIEIQQKLDQLQGSFSDSVGTPMIMQINPDMLPIMIAAVDVEGMDQIEIANYVKNDLIPSLESTEGVASVSASGALAESIQITLNQDKIDALNEKLADSINEKMDDAEKELKKGKSQIESGKKAISDGKEELIKQTTDANNQIENGRSQLITAKTTIDTALPLLESLYDSIDPMIERLNGLYNEAKAIEEQLKDAENVEDTLETVEGAYVDAAIADGSMQAPPGTEELVKAGFISSLESINGQVAGIVSTAAQLGLVGSTYEDIPSLIQQLSESKVQLAGQIEEMRAGASQVDDGLAAINDASKQLSKGQLEAMMQMSNGYADLATASLQVEQGQAQLDAARESALSQADLTKTLSVQTISQLLVAQNFDMPAGYAYDEDGNQFLVKVGESVKSIDDLRDLVLMDFHTDAVGVVRLSDVAEVEIVDNSDETYAIVNGNPGVMLTFEKQSGYSTGDVTDRLLDKFKFLEKQDETLHFAVMMNQGIYIDMVVSSVFQNMIFGAILAIIVLLLFLKDIKPTIIIACSIPLSVVTAVVLMYFTGISMNIISMSGLVLGIGMLVDNSIVVIENIYRLRSEGYSIKKAAVEGASQVTGAIIASTLTTISVYAPIIFTDGITRQLFVDLALTIAYTLVASLVVALTLVPAMASSMLTSTKEIKHPWFDKMMDVYGNFLELCLNKKLIVFVLSIVLLSGSAALCLSRGLDFMNMEMETNQLSATISAKEDEVLEFEELTAFSDTLVERIQDIEGVDTVGAMIGGGSTSGLMGGGGSDSVSLYILLEEDGKHDLNAVADQILEKSADLDCKVEVETNMMDMTAMMASGISIEIKGRDIDVIQDLTQKVANIVENTEGIAKVNDGLDNQADEFTITVDKEKAANYGYTVAQVFQMIYGEMASSSSATTLSTDIKDYDVFVQNETQQAAKLEDIKNFTFEHTNDDGEVEEVPITKIAEITNSTTLSTIKRTSQNRYLTVSGEIASGYNVTLVASEIQKELDKLDIPEGYDVSMKGEDEQINDAMGQMVLMLILAVIFIYLIMVAQFQSLLNPFIIMFSIPLAFTGGFIAIFISGTVLSVISMLGFVMLAGLIVNNGIVLIDYINQARREGKSKHDAIIESGKTRMRPILMTAMTTILAMSTTALGFGEGSEMMAPMAVSIIGGLIYGTVLTLVVIPCLYDVFNKEKSMVEEEL